MGNGFSLISECETEQSKIKDMDYSYSMEFEKKLVEQCEINLKRYFPLVIIHGCAAFDKSLKRLQKNIVHFRLQNGLICTVFYYNELWVIICNKCKYGIHEKCAWFHAFLKKSKKRISHRYQYCLPRFYLCGCNMF